MKDNKLIAEFMGGILSSVPNLINLPQTIGESNIFCVKGSEGLPNGTYNVERINDLKYHTSWDWLMPVVEKIEELPLEDVDGAYKIHRYKVDTSYNQCTITDTNTNEIIAYCDGEKRFSTHQAVVEFIKWYNENERLNNEYTSFNEAPYGQDDE